MGEHNICHAREILIEQRHLLALHLYSFFLLAALSAEVDGISIAGELLCQIW